MLSEFRYSTTVIDMMSWRGLGKTRIPERSQARLDHPQIAIVEGDIGPHPVAWRVERLSEQDLADLLHAPISPRSTPSSESGAISSPVGNMCGPWTAPRLG